jgi:hypothetical protein
VTAPCERIEIFLESRSMKCYALTALMACALCGSGARAQAQLRQALDAALTEARKAKRPSQLDERTGAFSLSLRCG